MLEDAQILSNIGSKRILVVDDQLFNIQALKIILKHSVGIPNSENIVDHCLNGAKALEMVKQDIERNCNMKCSYQLILMDCNMPVMDGYESSLKIRKAIFEAGLTQPIITAVTGHTEQAYLERCFSSGMN